MVPLDSSHSLLLIYICWVERPPHSTVFPDGIGGHEEYKGKCEVKNSNNNQYAVCSELYEGSLLYYLVHDTALLAAPFLASQSLPWKVNILRDGAEV